MRSAHTGPDVNMSSHGTGRGSDVLTVPRLSRMYLLSAGSMRGCDDGEEALDHLQLHCLVGVRSLKAVGHRRDHVVVKCSVWDAVGFIPAN